MPSQLWSHWRCSTPLSEISNFYAIVCTCSLVSLWVHHGGRNEEHIFWKQPMPKKKKEKKRNRHHTVCTDNKRQALYTGESNQVIISTAVLTRFEFRFLPFVLMKNTGCSRTFHAQCGNRNGENSRSLWVVGEQHGRSFEKMPPDDLLQNIFSPFSQRCQLINIWVFCSCRTGSTNGDQKCVYDATHVDSEKKREKKIRRPAQCSSD